MSYSYAALDMCGNNVRVRKRTALGGRRRDEPDVRECDRYDRNHRAEYSRQSDHRTNRETIPVIAYGFQDG